MTEKNIFAYNLFFVIKFFIFSFFFYVKIAPPPPHPPTPTLPEKSHPLFPTNPPLKVLVLSSPLFLKIWLEAQPLPLQKGGGGCILCNPLHGPSHFFAIFSISIYILSALVELLKNPKWGRWSKKKGNIKIGGRIIKNGVV